MFIRKGKQNMILICILLFSFCISISSNPFSSHIEGRSFFAVSQYPQLKGAVIIINCFDICNLFNSVISTIFFLLSLVLLKLGVKEINNSVDTIYILINDYRFVVSLIIWFVHYYFYRYFYVKVHATFF